MESSGENKVENTQKQIMTFIILGFIVLAAIAFYPYFSSSNNYQTQSVNTNYFNFANTTSSINVQNNSASFMSFSNNSQLKTYILENSLNLQNLNQIGFSNSINPIAYGANVLTSTTTTNTQPSSNTNQIQSVANQYSSILEPDVFSTDGNYLYAVSAGIVQIIPTNNLNESYNINLTNSSYNLQIQKIMVFNNTLVVFGGEYQNIFHPVILNTPSANQINAPATSQPNIQVNLPALKAQIAPANSIVSMPICLGCTFGQNNFIRVYNVTNPQTPILESQIDYHGSFVTARALNNQVYAIFDQPAGIYNPIPYYFLNGQEEFVPSQSIFYYADQLNNLNFQTIASINVSDSNNITANMNVILTNGYTDSNSVMFSNDSIYITHPIYQSLTPDFSDYQKVLGNYFDNQTLDEINTVQTSNLPDWLKNELLTNVASNFLDTLNTQQREQMNIDGQIAQILQAKFNGNYSQYTQIDKFDLNTLKFVAHSKIPGGLLNRYSMYENNGNFYIATQIPTESFGGYEVCNSDNSQGNYQCQYIQPTNYLNQSTSIYSFDTQLNPISQINGLLVNQDLNSVNYLGNYVYLNSDNSSSDFEELNISNPSQMNVVGNLNLQNNYQYFMPINNQMIFAAGYNLQRLNQIQEQYYWPSNNGLEFSLINATDNSNLGLVSNYSVGGPQSDSMVFSDSKSVLYSPTKNLIIVPVVLTNTTYNLSGDINYQFVGSLIFDLSNQSIINVANVTSWLNNTSTFNNTYPYDGYEISRSLIINNELYTYSNRQIIQTDLSNYSVVQKTNLASNIFYVYNMI